MQPQARCKQEGNREMEISKGKGPMVPVRQESQINRSALISQKGQCHKESTCDYWHPPECHHKSKGGCKWRDSCVFKHTSKAGEEENGKGTKAVTSEDTKEFNCVVNGAHTATFSVRSIPRKVGGH